MKSITILIYSFLYLYVTWFLFVGIMNMKRARDEGKISKTATILAYPWLILGYAMDILGNIVFCTVIFLELPHEYTITSRLKKHKNDTNWRGSVARWVNGALLSCGFDPDGDHLG